MCTAAPPGHAPAVRRLLPLLCCLLVLPACASTPAAPGELEVHVQHRAGANRILPVEVRGRCYQQATNPDNPSLPLELGSYPARLVWDTGLSLRVEDLTLPLEPAPRGACRR